MFKKSLNKMKTGFRTACTVVAVTASTSALSVAQAQEIPQIIADAQADATGNVTLGAGAVITVGAIALGVGLILSMFRRN